MDSREQSNEIWWLIEKINQQSDGKQFWSGSEWVTSALKAARFPSQEAAQNVLDNFIESISAFGTPYLLRAFAKPVEHIWVTVPQSKPQVRVSALIAEVLDQAKHEENPAGLKWIASRLASLDLLPDPPKEAELTPEEITTAIDYAYSEENMIHHRASDYDEMKLSAEQCVAQAAAKKARAFTLDEVLKDPEKFGLQPIPKVVQ